MPKARRRNGVAVRERVIEFPVIWCQRFGRTQPDLARLPQVDWPTGRPALGGEAGRWPATDDAPSLADFYLHLHLADFVLNRAVDGMFAQRAKVGIFGEPFKIAVPKQQCFFQSSRSAVELAVQGIAASQVVKDKRIARFKPGQPFVDLQAVFEFAALGIVIAEDLQGFDVLRVATNKTFEETDFHIKVARLFT